jgi:hypothetical protein
MSISWRALWPHCSSTLDLSIFFWGLTVVIRSHCICDGRSPDARSDPRSIPGTMSWVSVKHRTKPLLISRKNGRRRVSRRTCIRVLPGKEALNRRNRHLRSRLLLRPNQRLHPNPLQCRQMLHPFLRHQLPLLLPRPRLKRLQPRTQQPLSQHLLPWHSHPQSRTSFPPRIVPLDSSRH